MQAAVWAAASTGRDVLAVDAPGSGKTLAYLLPALRSAAAAAAVRDAAMDGGPPAAEGGEEPPGPSALVVVPSRELALQVQRAAAKVHKVFRVGAAAVHGGVGIDVHAEALMQRRPGLLVATPGRRGNPASRARPTALPQRRGMLA